MANCPKCNKGISILDVIVAERNIYCLNLIDGEFDHVERVQFEIQYWKCPVCHHKLDIEPNKEAGIAFLESE